MRKNGDLVIYDHDKKAFYLGGNKWGSLADAKRYATVEEAYDDITEHNTKALPTGVITLNAESFKAKHLDRKMRERKHELER